MNVNKILIRWFYFNLGALLISSGIVLHICVGAMLIIKSPRKKVKRKSINQPKDLKEKQETNDDGRNIPKTKNDIGYITSRIFSNWHFIILMLNTAMLHTGAAMVYTHIMAFAKSLGLSDSFGSVLISVIGFSNLVGRILTGLLTQAPVVNAVVLYTFLMSVCGKFLFEIVQKSYQLDNKSHS